MDKSKRPNANVRGDVNNLPRACSQKNSEESREVHPDRWPEEKRAVEVFFFYFYSAKLVPNRGTACLNFFALLTSLSGFHKLACANTVLS